MISAQTKVAAQEKQSNVQKMIQCRQRQWNSGLYKDKYCEGCVNKEACLEILGR